MAFEYKPFDGGLICQNADVQVTDAAVVISVDKKIDVWGLCLNA